MLQLKINDRSEFTFEQDENGIHLNGMHNDVDLIKLSAGTYHMIKDNTSFIIEVISQEGKTISLLVNGKRYSCEVKDKLDIQLDKMGISVGEATAENELKAPMPGLVLDIKVSVGQKVKTGESMVVLEAMKMENILKATADVTIKDIKVKSGQNVEKNAVLIEFES